MSRRARRDPNPEHRAEYRPGVPRSRRAVDSTIAFCRCLARWRQRLSAYPWRKIGKGANRPRRGSKSTFRRVPASVPSVIQGSLPCTPSSAWNTTGDGPPSPGIRARSTGVEGGLPGGDVADHACRFVCALGEEKFQPFFPRTVGEEQSPAAHVKEIRSRAIRARRCARSCRLENGSEKAGAVGQLHSAKIRIHRSGCLRENWARRGYRPPCPWRVRIPSETQSDRTLPWHNRDISDDQRNTATW